MGMRDIHGDQAITTAAGTPDASCGTSDRTGSPGEGMPAPASPRGVDSPPVWPKPVRRELAAIAAQLGQLERNLSRVLSSWRWRIGNGLISLLDTLLRRRHEEMAHESSRRIHRELADRLHVLAGGVRAVGAAGPGHLSPGGRWTGVVRGPYDSLSGYERTAPLLAPVLLSPYGEEDLRVLGVLDWQRRNLALRATGARRNALVSVIMATFNRADVIVRAVESVLAQSYPHWELIIVDDGSTDGTTESLQGLTDPRIRTIRLHANGGAGPARNRGLAKARGEYIAYLDSDNVWYRDYLLIMVNELVEQGAPAGYCAQRLMAIGADGAANEVGIRYAPFNRALIENRNFIDLNAFMHTRDLFRTCGGFREDLRKLLDWDLLLRYCRSTIPIPVPCVLCEYHSGRPDQLTVTEADSTAIRVVDESLGRNRLELASLAKLSVGHPLFGIDAPLREPRYRRPVSIIIPGYEALPCLRVCIEAILAYAPSGQYRIIIVDNASGPDVQRYLAKIRRPGVLDICYNERNLGFTDAVNKGLALAGPDTDVVLLNNDAVVTPGWLEALWEVVGDFPDAGLVVPRQVLPPNTRTIDLHVPFARTNRETDVNVSVHHDNLLHHLETPRKGYMELSFAPFFAVYIPRRTLDLAGPLDERNGPHYRSDRLYCEVVRRFLRRTIIYTPHSKIYHFLQQSTGNLREKDRTLYESMFAQNDWGLVQQDSR